LEVWEGNRSWRKKGSAARTLEEFEGVGAGCDELLAVKGADGLFEGFFARSEEFVNLFGRTGVSDFEVAAVGLERFENAT
jgi:hypothetical protein